MQIKRTKDGYEVIVFIPENSFDDLQEILRGRAELLRKDAEVISQSGVPESYVDSVKADFSSRAKFLDDFADKLEECYP